MNELKSYRVAPQTVWYGVAVLGNIDIFSAARALYQTVCGRNAGVRE